MVSCLPTWLAPNLITLSGLAILTAAYVTTAAYAPALEAVAPSWVYGLMAAATFAYLHLDVLDGKQARRTGSSSPLGQLFDHGCDALAVHLLIVGIGASIDTGLTSKAVVGQLAVMAPWIVAHWEEYHSGHIRYGNGWWGVTEANYVLIMLHLITAFAGPALWRAPAPDLLARLGIRVASLPSPLAFYLSACVGTDLLLVGIVSAGVFQVSGPLWRVLAAPSPGRGDAPLPAAQRGAKQLGRPAAAAHAAQLGLLLGLGAVAMLEPIRAGRPDWHVRVVFGSFGVVYALEVRRGNEEKRRERTPTRRRRGRCRGRGRCRCRVRTPGEKRERAAHPRTLHTHHTVPPFSPPGLQADHGPHGQGAVRAGLVAARPAGGGRGQLGGRRWRGWRGPCSRGRVRRRRPGGRRGRVPALRPACHLGDVRPPGHPVPVHHAARGREEGQGWGGAGGEEDSARPPHARCCCACWWRAVRVGAGGHYAAEPPAYFCCDGDGAEVDAGAGMRETGREVRARACVQSEDLTAPLFPHPHTMPPRRAPPPAQPPHLLRGLSLAAAATTPAVVVLTTAAIITRLSLGRLAAVQAGAPAAAAAAAESAIEAALAALLAGRRDLALHAAGGRVVGHSPLAGAGGEASAAAPALHPQAHQWLLSPPPGGVPLPGRCLPLAGAAGGWVEVRLRVPSVTTEAPPPPPYLVSAITLEAPPPALSFPEGRAALPSRLGVSLSTDATDGRWADAGEVAYNASAVAGLTGLAQTTRLAAPGPARAVRLRVLANQGHPGATCLYRVRVHGEE